MTQEMLDNQMRKTFTMRTRVNVLFTHAKWREPIGAQSKQITADWVRNQKKKMFVFDLCGMESSVAGCPPLYLLYIYYIFRGAWPNGRPSVERRPALAVFKKENQIQKSIVIQSAFVYCARMNREREMSATWRTLKQDDQTRPLIVIMSPCVWFVDSRTWCISRFTSWSIPKIVRSCNVSWRGVLNWRPIPDWRCWMPSDPTIPWSSNAPSPSASAACWTTRPDSWYVHFFPFRFEIAGIFSKFVPFHMGPAVSLINNYYTHVR